jgi:hypothetical protein
MNRLGDQPLSSGQHVNRVGRVGANLPIPRASAQLQNPAKVRGRRDVRAGQRRPLNVISTTASVRDAAKVAHLSAVPGK